MPSSWSLIVAPRGPARDRFVQAQTATSSREGRIACRVNVDRASEGPYSGVSRLIETWRDRAARSSPELLVRFEPLLAQILPSSGERALHRSLTETVPDDERIRVFPPDRQHRVAHGLIDFLRAVLRAEERLVAVVCEDYGAASRWARFFLRELVRRCGDLPLELFLVVEPAELEETVAEWKCRPPLQVFHPEIAAGEAGRDPELEAQHARCLEEAIARDSSAERRHLYWLLEHWERSGQEEKALWGRVKALRMLHHSSFYEDAQHLVPLVADSLEALCARNEPFRLALLIQIYSVLVAVGKAEEALEIIQREGLPRLADPRTRGRVHYILAMLHLRFLPVRNPDLAEAHLLASIEDARRSELPEAEKQLSIAFSLNGLALVRLRQNRPEEAIEICRSCLRSIDEHFQQNRHQLFRSVLLYNISQVHGGLARWDEGIDYLTAALEMDPNYAEYYNERGCLFLKAGRSAAAGADFRRAIELGPPSAEVWTNLGQCHRLAGEAEQAIAAYSAALDITPGLTVALAGRAQASRSLGRLEDTCADYSALLRLDPSPALVWANRAALHHQAGRFAESLADLNEAILRAPGLADLYSNRALALKALGRDDQAQRDERRARELRSL